MIVNKIHLVYLLELKMSMEKSQNILYQAALTRISRVFELHLLLFI